MQIHYFILICVFLTVVVETRRPTFRCRAAWCRSTPLPVDTTTVGVATTLEVSTVASLATSAGMTTIVSKTTAEECVTTMLAKTTQAMTEKATDKTTQRSSTIVAPFTTAQTTVESSSEDEEDSNPSTPMSRTSTEEGRVPVIQVAGQGLSHSAIVGISVGTVIFILLLAATSCYCVCSRRRGTYRLGADVPGLGHFQAQFNPGHVEMTNYILDDDEDVIASFSIDNVPLRQGGTQRVVRC